MSLLCPWWDILELINYDILDRRATKVADIVLDKRLKEVANMVLLDSFFQECS